VRVLFWWWQTIWATARKDIRIALAERSVMIQSVTLPVNYLIMMALFVLSGSHAPTAVVMADHGPYARQFLTALEQAHSFRLHVTTAAEAAQQMRQGTLVAVVTIPAGFDRAVTHGTPIAIPATINNLNQDLTDDAHRALRLAVATFYAHTRPAAMPIVTSETDAYPHDVGYIPFIAVSIIVIALMVGGMLQAGNAAAREWEQRTVKLQLLSPAHTWAILTGQTLGAFIVALPAGAVVMAGVVFVAGDHPASLPMAAGVSLLTLAVFVAAGTALGTAIKDRSALATLIRALPVPLFFLSGVFAPVTFETPAVRSIAVALPTHYAIVLEQAAFLRFATGTLPLGTDALILAGCFLVFLALASAALARSHLVPGTHGRAAGRHRVTGQPA
jgi:ABC-2 type transport system permease protein